MSDDQFTKLFKYVKEFRDEMIDRFEQTDARIDRLTSTIDSFVKRLDDNDIEMKSRDLQFKRLLDWAREVSAKTGIPLKNL